MKDFLGIKSLKPLPKLGKELEERPSYPKGMVSQRSWEKSKFKKAFKKEA